MGPWKFGLLGLELLIVASESGKSMTEIVFEIKSISLKIVSGKIVVGPFDSRTAKALLKIRRPKNCLWWRVVTGISPLPIDFVNWFSRENWFWFWFWLLKLFSRENWLLKLFSRENWLLKLFSCRENWLSCLANPPFGFTLSWVLTKASPVAGLEVPPPVPGLEEPPRPPVPGFEEEVPPPPPPVPGFEEEPPPVPGLEEPPPVPGLEEELPPLLLVGDICPPDEPLLPPLGHFGG